MPGIVSVISHVSCLFFSFLNVSCFHVHSTTYYVSFFYLQSVLYSVQGHNVFKAYICNTGCKAKEFTGPVGLLAYFYTVKGNGEHRKTHKNMGRTWITLHTNSNLNSGPELWCNQSISKENLNVLPLSLFRC